MDTFAKFIIYLIIPVVAGNFVLKQPQNTPQDTTEAVATVTAEVAEPPSTQKFNPQDYIKEVFGSDAKIALAVARAESGIESKRGLKANRDGSWDWGIFQINDYWHCPKVGEVRSSDDCHRKFMDAKTNIDTAKQIFDDSGWFPWSVFKNGKYKEYL